MKIDLSGQAAIVTGAAGGIGRAVCLRLAEAGASVLAVDLDAAEATRTAELVTRAGGKARAARADVSRADDVASYVVAAHDAFGRIDILMNNAGRQGAVKPLVDCDDDEFDAVMDVNVRGVFLGMKHVLPAMLTAGRGAIVNTASLGAFIGVRNLGPYAASKHAVMGLTRSAALEVARAGIRINAVCPGPVDTALLRDIERGQARDGDGDELHKRRVASIPQGRYATPEDVAGVMVFLASDLAAHIVGQGVHVNGGTYG
ncbi:MAG: SDR family NAD(P)-dependent oxidoreductase [Hyphomicrobiales bacterium]|nr:SDR family NAD(P)-dependent oxidoreductase [Hyphomicrobiales bacterium]